MKKKLGLFWIIGLVLLMLPSCGSVKDLAYLQAKEEQEILKIAGQEKSFDSRIKSKDILTVSIGALDKTAVEAFNIPNTYISSNGYTNGTGYPSYIVDNDGNINLPVIGSVNVLGKTEKQVEELIKAILLKNYINEMVSVNVRIINYQVSVLGEVNRPGRYNVDNGKINIFQALSQAGDLTIYGDRKQVKLLRESDGEEKLVVTLDLNDVDILKSPYFYLQQGDVLYVQPNKARAQSSGISSGTTIWFSVVSVLTSIATLLVSILR
ncbi:polysaccharide biosynthesis/export family protein [Porphyromonas macacae]|uniref:polysaccharide biosynthesis/export family protein n=1 Tax=Porphyromonas macacae TaxID=28115 RepID=UPI0024AD74B4|nr:polysaccharide biosynthesis/export family protein [Porphyromonas macacae]